MNRCGLEISKSQKWEDYRDNDIIGTCIFRHIRRELVFLVVEEREGIKKGTKIRRWWFVCNS